VLTEAAVKGEIDRLVGLKENVIIGKLIPASSPVSEEPPSLEAEEEVPGLPGEETPTLAAAETPSLVAEETPSLSAGEEKEEEETTS
jgi:hypothetical protein